MFGPLRDISATLGETEFGALNSTRQWRRRCLSEYPSTRRRSFPHLQRARGYGIFATEPIPELGGIEVLGGLNTRISGHSGSGRRHFS
jgi:hypothetical protein